MSGTSKASAAERIRRGSPAVQPSSARSVSGQVRVKPYKLTVSLEPGLYEGLREWAHQNRTSHQAVLEGLVQALLSGGPVDAELRKYVDAD